MYKHRTNEGRVFAISAILQQEMLVGNNGNIKLS